MFNIILKKCLFKVSSIKNFQVKITILTQWIFPEEIAPYAVNRRIYIYIIIAKFFKLIRL